VSATTINGARDGDPGTAGECSDQDWSVEVRDALFDLAGIGIGELHQLAIRKGSAIVIME
jgi:hypothetical protein